MEVPSNEHPLFPAVESRLSLASLQCICKGVDCRGSQADAYFYTMWRINYKKIILCSSLLLTYFRMLHII